MQEFVRGNFVLELDSPVSFVLKLARVSFVLYLVRVSFV